MYTDSVISDKIRILSGILGNSYKSNDEYLYRCPSCGHHKRKLSVNFSSNVFKCWICDYRGKSIRRIIRRYGNRQQLQEWDRMFSGRHDMSEHSRFQLFATEEVEDEKTILNLPDDFKTLATANRSRGSIAAYGYLKNRGLTERDILKYKIGYSATGDYAGRIIIPSFDTQGELNYFVARAYDGAWNRYKNPPASRNIVFNDLMIDWDKDVILVEGVFDAIKADNSIPILGSSLRDDSILFKKIVAKDACVYIALDKDARKKEEKIIKNLLKHDIETYKIDVSGYDDVGEMPKDVFAQRKREAKSVSSDSYLLYQAIYSL